MKATILCMASIWSLVGCGDLVKASTDASADGKTDRDVTDASLWFFDATDAKLCKAPQASVVTVDSGPPCWFMGLEFGRWGECDQGEVCCGRSQCSAPSACNEAGTEHGYVCGAPAQCSQGFTCCLNGAGSTSDPPCVGYRVALQPEGTSCASACAPETQLCSSTADCPSGTACVPLAVADTLWLSVCTDGGT